MNIPCVNRLPFVVIGLSFLQPAFTNAQFNNLTLIATALVLWAKFSLNQINLLWLKERSVSTLSWFMSDAKFSTREMMHLYALQSIKTYEITDGYFLIDDTLQHHTKFCQLIHGVFVLFDHAVGTNLKSKCIVFLYYSDEEFFRNAKQLSDIEGATIRSEQGVTLALCLVSRIDFLLHLENYKHCTAGELSQDSLTIPSIVRRAQYENLTAFIKKVQTNRKFVEKRLKVEKERIDRKRKEQHDIVELGTAVSADDALHAA